MLIALTIALAASARLMGLTSRADPGVAAVEERLRGLCAEAARLAAELPVSPGARRILAGAASALLPS